MNIKNSKIVPYYYLGKGSYNNLAFLVESKKNETNSFVVCVVDHFFESKNLIDLSFLTSDDIIIWANTSKEPTTDYVDTLVSQIKLKDCLPSTVVGIGGGSTLDISKAISVLLTNDGPSVNYQGWDLVKNPGIYKIGVPTIAGTGAEFTRTCVLTGPLRKLGINSDYSVFDQVILDAELMKTVPINQFVYTAMDCFVHNEESLLGRINDTMTIALAEKSLEMIKDVFLNEMDTEKLLVASSLGGLAVANSSVGICHPLSYGLSMVLGLPHGFSICIAFNQLEEYYPNVTVFKEILKKHKIELPKIMENISEEKLDQMADATLINEKPLMNAFGDNWREKFGKDKIKDLLRKM